MIVVVARSCRRPFLLAAPLLSGSSFIVVLAIGGFFLQSTLPVNVVFGQALAPVSAATVSSLMMGFAWGMGGLSVPIVGAIADRYGIEHTLIGLAFIPLAGRGGVDGIAGARAGRHRLPAGRSGRREAGVVR